MKTLSKDLPLFNLHYERVALILFAAAAILYNSWPLGYVLDKQTAHAGLASDLELVGHPYYWVFILGDELTAACIIAATILLIYGMRLGSPSTKTKTLAMAGLAAFGLFTAVAALLPYQCTITPLLRCGADHGRGFGLDAVTSSVAASGLLISLSAVTLNRGTGAVTRLAQGILAMWVVSGLWFAVLALSNRNAHVAQLALMIISGLAVIAIGLNI